MGRHIEALETALGLSLFTRSQGGLQPTAAAMTLVASAEAMEAAAAGLQRNADGARSDAGGTVRITASEIMGAEVLPEILSAFREQHSDITLELVLSNRNDDLLRRDADIAVRMNRPTQEALLAQRLGEVRLGLFAHERYLARHGVPESIEALTTFDIIGFDREDRSARSLAAGRSLSTDHCSAFAPTAIWRSTPPSRGAWDWRGSAWPGRTASRASAGPSGGNCLQAGRLARHARGPTRQPTGQTGLRSIGRGPATLD